MSPDKLAEIGWYTIFVAILVAWISARWVQSHWSYPGGYSFGPHKVARRFFYGAIVVGILGAGAFVFFAYRSRSP